MKLIWVIVMASFALGSTALAGGRKPAGVIPKPTSQAEQMLNSVRKPTPSFSKTSASRPLVRVYGSCRTAYGAYTNCMESNLGSSADASNALRQGSGAVLIGP